MILILLVAFLLELVAFAILPAVVLLFGLNSILQIIFYIILLICITSFWGIFMSPKAVKKLSPLNYLIFKTIIYTATAFLIFAFSNLVLAVGYIVLWIINEMSINKFHPEIK